MLSAHPRSRGEHCLLEASDSRERGSSPLTRGALSPASDLGGEPGLIPAHAGSTSRSPGRRHARAAHPRSRGEHTTATPVMGYQMGSSPLTRGARHSRHAQSQASRLIPAHAGSTPCPPSSPPTRSAHPRSRGEHLDRVCSGVFPCGSSPLTRGAPRRFARRPH